jgi:molecular chaperone HscB
MNLQSNDFELFGLPERFAQDAAAIAARWKALQRETHPDRFAAQGAAAQRVAMQWSVRVNEAHQRLKDPQRRAAYLCELHGAPIDAEHNTSMPPAFLMQQMEWREALDDAGSAADVQRIADELVDEKDQVLAQLGQLIDEKRDYPAAAAQVRVLMFLDKFQRDLRVRQQALAQGSAVQ